MRDVAITFAGIALAFASVACARSYPRARAALGWIAMTVAFWSLMWGFFAHVELMGITWGIVLGGLVAVPAALAIRAGAELVSSPSTPRQDRSRLGAERDA